MRLHQVGAKAEHEVSEMLRGVEMPEVPQHNDADSVFAWQTCVPPGLPVTRADCCAAVGAMPHTTHRWAAASRYTCDVCSRTFSGDTAWKEHLKGRPHKRATARKRKREAMACKLNPL